MTVEIIPDSSNKICGIYTITCTANGRVYVGSSINIKHRFYVHAWKLRNGSHANKHLANAWNKYGESAFLFSVVEIVADPSKLVEREQHWIDMTGSDKSGFNQRRVAESNRGMKFPPRSEETLRKMSASMMGKNKGRQQTEEERQKRANSRRGKSPSPETRRKISLAHMGIRHTPEMIKQIADKLRGQKRGPHSEETRRKISEAQVGKVLSEEHRKKLSDSHKGHTHTEEHKEKIAAALRGRKQSEETKRKISATKRAKRKSVT